MLSNFKISSRMVMKSSIRKCWSNRKNKDKWL